MRQKIVIASIASAMLLLPILPGCKETKETTSDNKTTTQEPAAVAKTEAPKTPSETKSETAAPAPQPVAPTTDTKAETKPEATAAKTEAPAAAPATGGEMHVISAAGVRFKPMFVYINPGDKVSFENMPSHNVETVEPLVPEGQEKIKTELGDNVTLTFSKPGLVVFKCSPHWGNRMGGIIVVGKPDNPEQVIEDYMALTELPENKSTLPARGLLKKLKKDMKKKGLI